MFVDTATRLTTPGLTILRDQTARSHLKTSSPVGIIGLAENSEGE
jgi:hypothetical protein